MAEILGFEASTRHCLAKITIEILRRLRRHEIWRRPSLRFNKLKQRLHISPGGLQYTPIEEDRVPIETRRVVFHGLCPMDTYLDDITGPRLPMLYRRIVMETAKKVPSWRKKNLFYRGLGVGIHDRKTTIIAPNVFVDYIYPQLIESIGANTLIGEEAALVTHFLYPDRAEIGAISIGKNCLIGARALIAPGVVIGDNATIGAYAVVTRDVPAGATVRGPKSDLLLPVLSGKARVLRRGR